MEDPKPKTPPPEDETLMGFAFASGDVEEIDPDLGLPPPEKETDQ